MKLDAFAFKVCLPALAVIAIGALAYVLGDLTSEPKQEPKHELEIVEAIEVPQEPVDTSLPVAGDFDNNNETDTITPEADASFDDIKAMYDEYGSSMPKVYPSPLEQAVVENSEADWPPVRHLLKDGNGHDYVALSDREKMRLCMIIAEVVGVKTDLYYHGFLGAFYSDVSFRNRSISEAVAVAAAWSD